MIAKWLVISYLALNALYTIATVGRPRKPLSATAAAATVAVAIAMIVAMVIWWH